MSPAARARSTSPSSSSGSTLALSPTSRWRPSTGAGSATASQPAFNAWLATRPFVNTDAALTPFELPQYAVPEARRADALELKAKAYGEVARVDIQHADDYVLCVVLLASALFFAGLSTRLRTLRSEATILGLGWIVLLGTTIYMATLPITVAI